MAGTAEVDLRETVLSNSSFGPVEIQQLSEAVSADFSCFAILRDAVAELEVREDRSPATAVRLGVCYYLLGRFDKALETLSNSDADGSDGLLDLCTFEHGSFWQGLRYLTGIFAGDCNSWSDCQKKRVRKVRLESDQPVPVQLDGDPAGFLPLDVEILPGRLNLLTTKAWAAKNGFPKTAELG